MCLSNHTFFIALVKNYFLGHMLCFIMLYVLLYCYCSCSYFCMLRDNTIVPWCHSFLLKKIDRSCSLSETADNWVFGQQSLSPLAASLRASHLLTRGYAILGLVTKCQMIPAVSIVIISRSKHCLMTSPGTG